MKTVIDNSRISRANNPDFATLVLPQGMFPIDWDTEYYALVSRCEHSEVGCSGCGGTGRVTLRDNREWACPKCGGAGKHSWPKEKCRVKEFCLHRVVLTQDSAEFVFQAKGSNRWCGEEVLFGFRDLATMQLRTYHDEPVRYLYNDLDSAREAADRLNAQAGGEGAENE